MLAAVILLLMFAFAWLMTVAAALFKGVAFVTISNHPRAIAPNAQLPGGQCHSHCAWLTCTGSHMRPEDDAEVRQAALTATREAAVQSGHADVAAWQHNSFLLMHASPWVAFWSRMFNRNTRYAFDVTCVFAHQNATHVHVLRLHGWEYASSTREFAEELFRGAGNAGHGALVTVLAIERSAVVVDARVAADAA